jgi:hypothetical protein
MNKFGMILATLVALQGATASWAQDTEEAEPAAVAAPIAVPEPAGCNTGCCDTGCRAKQETCRSRFRARVAGCCDRSDCNSSCNESGRCDKSCGKKCSLSAICEWLCFRRETVCCPKGPDRRRPPLYTFFPCDDCGDGCGGACANHDCCSSCNK